VIAVFFDALLYAATVKVLSLSTREFGLYNLAGGAWVILGGWAAAAVLGPFVGAPAPLHPWVFVLFLILACLQVSVPFILGSRIGVLRDNPLMYLFISLGVALVILSLGPGALLENYGDTIPIQQGWWGWVALVAFSAFVIVLVYWIFRGGRWARLVIDFRVASSSGKLPIGLSLLLLVELVLLILLGAAGYQVHKGIFQSAEYRTIIPVLCLALAKSSPGRAALLSFIIIVSTHMLDAWVSVLAGYSIPVAISVLIVAVLIRKWPRETVIDNNATNLVPTRTVGLLEDSVFVGGVVFLVLAVFSTLTLAWSANQLTLHKTLLFSVLVTMSWIAQRHLGVVSMTWPVVAAISVYLVESLASRPVYIMFAMSLVAVLWASYILILRVLSKESALVIDLSVVICIHHIVTNSTAIAGPTNVKLLPLSLSSWNILAIQITLVLGALGLVLWANHNRIWRGSLLALANFRLGRLHGVAVTSVFIVAATVLATVSMISTVAYHALPTPLGPDELSLGVGLSVLLIGNFMDIKGPAPGLLVVFFIYGLLGSVLVGRGILSGAIIGLAFISFVLSTEVFRASRINARTT
jgi:hypothetical protein